VIVIVGSNCLNFYSCQNYDNNKRIAISYLNANKMNLFCFSLFYLKRKKPLPSFELDKGLLLYIFCEKN